MFKDREFLADKEGTLFNYCNQLLSLQISVSGCRINERRSHLFPYNSNNRVA